MRSLLHRYGSINVPITSAGVIIYGIALIVADPTSPLSGGVNHGPLEVAPKLTWAIGMIASGVLALATRHIWAVLPLLVTITAWTIAVVIACVTVDGVSSTAGIGWSIICTQLLTSVAIRGTHNPHYAFHQRQRR